MIIKYSCRTTNKFIDFHSCYFFSSSSSLSPPLLSRSRLLRIPLDARGVLQIFPIIHLNRANFLYIELVTLHLPALGTSPIRTGKEEKWPRLLTDFSTRYSFICTGFTFHKATIMRSNFIEKSNDHLVIWLLVLLDFSSNGLEAIAGKICDGVRFKRKCVVVVHIMRDEIDKKLKRLNF